MMKNTTHTILWVLLAILSAGCSSPADDGVKLRVLSWNVWHAGHSEAFPEEGYRGATIRATASECLDCRLGKPFRFRGGEFFYPSDHGFVMTDFRIDTRRRR